MTEAIVDIRSFSGTTANRELTDLYEDVRCFISSARVEVAILYENVPLGKLFEFVIKNSDIDEIPAGAEITVTHPQQTGIDKDTIFIVNGQTQKQRTSGRFIITGTCYRKED